MLSGKVPERRRNFSSAALQGDQLPVALQAAGVIVTRSSQHGIADAQLRFGQVASDKVGVLRCKLRAAQSLGCIEKSRTAIEQKAGRFVGGNGRGVEMMLATIEQGIISHHPVVSRHEVIAEHRHLAPLQ